MEKALDLATIWRVAPKPQSASADEADAGLAVVHLGMKSPTPNEAGLAEALAVADGRATPPEGEVDAKLLALLLHDGECTAEITDSQISIWYSWLRQWRPSIYFKSLAPAVLGRLMQLGGVDRIDDEATFQVGPGTAGTGRYVFVFKHKWIRIRRGQERILILVRDDRNGLDEEVTRFDGAVARCERCNDVLRTPLAKQCLSCGYDWH